MCEECCCEGVPAEEPSEHSEAQLLAEDFALTALRAHEHFTLDRSTNRIFPKTGGYDGGPVGDRPVVTR